MTISESEYQHPVPTYFRSFCDPNSKYIFSVAKKFAANGVLMEKGREERDQAR